MNAGAFSSMASAALSFAGTLASVESSKSMQNKELQYNAEQAGINRDWQTNERIAAQEYYTDLFNQANEWNSIGSELERGRAAGVSPSAIISGKFNSPSAQPSMPHVGSGSQASTSSGGAIGSALVGAMPNMLNATGSFVKNMTDSFVARDMLGLNKQYISSQIHGNYAKIKETLSNAGVADATEAQIYQSMRWAEGLNAAEQQRRIAQSTLYYNQCADILSMIEFRKAQATNLEFQNANLAGQTYLSYVQGNKVNIEAAIAEIYGSQIAIEEITQEQLETIESRIRVGLAQVLGAPVNSSDFALTYNVWKKGELPTYCSDVLYPINQAGWKPNDHVIREHRQYGPIKFDRPHYYFGGFNPYTGDINQSSLQGASIYDARRNAYRRRHPYDK